MKAISLHQPWATLISIGAKKFETRSWAPPAALRGLRIAIHAAKRKFDPAGDVDLATHHDMSQALARAGLTFAQLPLGVVVCTAELFNAQRALQGDEPPDRFGDYCAGRWVWHLVDVRPLEPPVPFLGRQRIFEIPDSILTPNRKDNP